MPEYKIAKFKMEDGRIANFRVPEEYTREQAEQEARAYFEQNRDVKSFNARMPTPSLSEIPGLAFSNAPESAYDYAKGRLGAIANLKGTANTLVDVAAGGIRKAMPETFNVINDAFNQKVFGLGNEAPKNAERTFESAVDYYADRFGTPDQWMSGNFDSIKKTAAYDPVGLASDLSIIFGGASGMTSKISPRISGALSKASKITNPLTGPVWALKKGIPLITGGMTVTGADASKQAFLAGKNQRVNPLSPESSFIENLRNNVEPQKVVDIAKRGLLELRDQRNREYIAQEAILKQDPTILSLGKIKRAIRNASGETRHGHFVYRPNTESVVTRINQRVSEFERLYKADPGFYGTPFAIDKLKQSVRSIMDDLPPNTDQMRSAGNIYNAIRSEIVRQAPNYGKMMADYEKASDDIFQIERTFSIGKKAAMDTGMRKLQSLTRNNVYTNYGTRQHLADLMRQRTGIDLMPPVSGQAMSSLTSRGLTGQFENLGTLLYGIQNPAALGLLPFQSPRLMGEALHGAGRAYGLFANPLERELGRYGIPFDSRLINALPGRER